MNETSLSLLDQLRTSTDNAAWDRLNRMFGPLIRKWLIKYDVQSTDVDDLAQEVLLAVSKDISTFEHNGRPGAFRAWLKGILVNRLRNFWRSRDRNPTSNGSADLDSRLQELNDPASQVTHIWNKEHDEHVLRTLMSLVEPHFEGTTWAAFRKVTVEGVKPNVAAEELGISLNAVWIAKSRVLSRLRQEAAGLIESSSTFLPCR